MAAGEREARVGEPLPPIDESAYSPGAVALEPPNPEQWRMAKHIRVEQTDLGAARIYIDGELLPYYTANTPKVVRVGRTQLPTLVIELVAETIDVHATMNRADD